MRKKSEIKPNIKIRSSFMKKLFLGWILSLFIPFIVLFIIAFVQYGDSFLNVLSGNLDFWQRNSYSSIEQVSRDINVWANHSPEFQNHEKLNDQLIRQLKNYHVKQGFILERKGQVVKSFLPVTNQDSQDVQNMFKSLNTDLLPEFGDRNVKTNETILNKTGYLIYKQYDFYYGDGSEGSIFIFIKYTNVPAIILKFVGENLLFLILGLLLVHGFVSYKFIKKITKPLNALLDALKRYQNQDFTIRLDETIKEPALYTINTAVNEMADDLQLNQENANRIEHQRIEFIAKISHDTKTPLASIRAHAEAFRDGLINDEDKRLKYTNNILKKVQSIDNMINELSLYSDLEAGINQYEFTDVDLNYYFSDIFEELNYDYGDVNLSINYNELKEKNLIASLDVNRFNRVLMNIIKNSVWYSNSQNLTIDVKPTYHEEENLVELSIKDNGVGINLENLENLFDSFVRGESFRDPNKGGSGLGLAIAKSIIEKHHGTIRAMSKLNEFFEIIIVLPVKRSESREKSINY